MGNEMKRFKKAVDEFKNCNNKIELWKCVRRLNGFIAKAAKFDTGISASDIETIIDGCKIYESCGDVALLRELRALLEAILRAIYAGLIHADQGPIHLQRVTYKAHLTGKEINKSISKLHFDFPPENSATLQLSELANTP